MEVDDDDGGDDGDGAFYDDDGAGDDGWNEWRTAGSIGTSRRAIWTDCSAQLSSTGS